ncbi:MAG: DsbA family protein [Candidatus Saccharimonadales bacterium]
MSKFFWGVLGGIVVIFGLVFIFTHNNNNKNSNNTSSQPTHNVEGQDKANVSFVEYGDYECPYCEEYASIVSQVVSDEFSNISFQFVNFPLTSIHPNAFSGARAAQAAGLMGKFWQMHDALYSYSNWNVWSTSSNPVPYFKQYAQQLGLNVNTFMTNYNSTKVNNMIEADINKGNNLNIQGTPTFYLNGKQIQVAAQVSAFEKLINAAVANNGKVSNTTSGSTAQTTK